MNAGTTGGQLRLRGTDLAAWRAGKLVDPEEWKWRLCRDRTLHTWQVRRSIPRGRRQSGFVDKSTWPTCPAESVLLYLVRHVVRIFCWADAVPPRQIDQFATKERVLQQCDPITHEADTYLCKILRWSFFVRYLLFGHYVPSSRIVIRYDNVGVLRIGGFISNMNTQATLIRKVMQNIRIEMIEFMLSKRQFVQLYKSSRHGLPQNVLAISSAYKLRACAKCVPL